MEIDDKAIKLAINEVAATEAGKVLLVYLKDFCKWDYTYLSSESPQVTQYHAAVRGVYNNLRNLIDDRYLKIIEFDIKRKAVKNDRRKNKNTN